MGEKNYIGRIVAIARTHKDEIITGYRVSSRSFANRKIVRNGDVCSVMPVNPEEYRDNPYVSYNCLRHNNNVLIISNGSHTDPIIEKISLGYPVRDAIASSLLTLDYEKDKYCTPRIVSAVDYKNNSMFLAIIKPDKLEVRGIALNKGEACLIATYELTDPWKFDTKAGSVNEFAAEILSLEFTHPVCSLGAKLSEGKLDVGMRNL
jgi:IMP cyclohydrolase